MNDMLAVQDEDCLRRVVRNPAPRRSPVQFFSKVTFAAAPEVLSCVPGSKLVAGAHMVSSRETHSLKGILRRTSAFGVPAPSFISTGKAWPSNSLSQLHPVGSTASVLWPTEVRCEAGQDASLTVTSAFLLAQVQCEHSSLSQPVCPVGSTANGIRP